MRFLFFVFAEPGHLHPMIGVAQHLVQAGHHVSFFASDDLTARLAAAGLPVRCHVAPAGAHEGRRESRNTDLAVLLNRPAFARRWYRYALLTQVPAQIAGLREAVALDRPDVIVTDPLAYAAVIVAEQARLPWAAVSTQLLSLTPADFRCPYIDALDDGELTAERERLFAGEGVTARFALGEAISPHLSTVFATEALARPSQRGDVRCVGPSSPIGRRGDEAAFPWERLRAGAPLVYVSFGSQLAPSSEVFEALASTIGPNDADLVIAFRDLGTAPALPAHVIAVGWAPQLALLERAAVMVTHGGANSVAECLRRGVPALVVPLGYEQPLQACLIERSGAGLAIAPEAATAEALGAAVRTLLADGPHRRRAAEIGRSYAAADGARTTAELLAAL